MNREGSRCGKNVKRSNLATEKKKSDRRETISHATNDAGSGDQYSGPTLRRSRCLMKKRGYH